MVLTDEATKYPNLLSRGEICSEIMVVIMKNFEVKRESSPVDQRQMGTVPATGVGRIGQTLRDCLSSCSFE